MSIKIRLRKVGTKKKPHFKIVVCSLQEGRDSSSVETLGYYDPSANPPLLKINRERIDYWIGVGAELSDTIRDIIKRPKK
jgi:small subunit ribosomal protein S16